MSVSSSKLLCVEAARRKDLAALKGHATSYLKQPGAKPEDLVGCLKVSVSSNNVDIVEYMLSIIPKEHLPGEFAVRVGNIHVLDLFFACGWDLNKPISDHEPPVLWYSVNS